MEADIKASLFYGNVDRMPNALSRRDMTSAGLDWRNPAGEIAWRNLRKG